MNHKKIKHTSPTDNNSGNQFRFQLQKRKPMWKEMSLFVLSVLCFWGGSHIALNYSAYSQIAEFKIDAIQNKGIAEVKAENSFTPQVEKLKEVTLVQQNTRKPLFASTALKPKNEAKRVFRDMDIYPSDNRLYIPSLDKNVPLITVPHHKNWNQLETNIQKGLQDGVVVHPVSRPPEKEGNLFITGHSSYYTWDNGRFKDVFALLHEMNTNEIVEVYWNGKKYTYLIKAKKVVPPTATQVLKQPDDVKIITLMTCTPIGTNKNRLILIGEQIENTIDNEI